MFENHDFEEGKEVVITLLWFLLSKEKKKCKKLH